MSNLILKPGDLQQVARRPWRPGFNQFAT